MTRRTVARAASRRAVVYAAIFLGTSIVLSLLPGGRYGTAATIVLVAAGIGMIIWLFRRYARLRREEDTPFVGSQRAEELLLALLGAPVVVALGVVLLTDADAVFWGALIVCGAVWLGLMPLVVISGRRRGLAESRAGNELA